MLKKGHKLIVGYVRIFLALSAALLAGTAVGLAVPPAPQDGPASERTTAKTCSPAITQAVQILAEDLANQAVQAQQLEELECRLFADLSDTQQAIDMCRFTAARQQLTATSVGLNLPLERPLLSSPQDLQNLADYITGIIRRNQR